ncbi:MAG TPA: hypothetical protein VEG60_28770, partial [Candidatus Binatia bacterium]|nr:hypothetical protein [Candidatus Binatia bacterium]
MQATNCCSDNWKCKNQKRAVLLAILVSLIGYAGMADAQQQVGKVARLGYVSSTGTIASDTSFAALRR